MIRTLNSLRFILILMIVMSHATLPISQACNDYLGEYAVVIFFIISGFVLSLSYGERLVKEEMSNKKFFLSRIFKLYPLHLLVIAIIIPLDYRLGLLGPWYQTVAHMFLLQCWIPIHEFMGGLNGPTWFLSDLIIYYFLFKYLYRWLMQRKKALPLVIFIIYYLSIYTNPNFRCAALYWLPAVVSIFYFVASDQGKGWLTRLFHHKALLWLGSISFEIFICHSLCFRIVQSIFIRMFGIDNPYWEYKLIIALTLTILTSWMAKKFLVTPCSNYLKKYIK